MVKGGGGGAVIKPRNRVWKTPPPPRHIYPSHTPAGHPPALHSPAGTPHRRGCRDRHTGQVHAGRRGRHARPGLQGIGWGHAALRSVGPKKGRVVACDFEISRANKGHRVGACGFELWAEGLGGLKSRLGWPEV